MNHTPNPPHSTPARPASVAASSTLCVVWSRPDRAVPAELLALLESKRGVRIERSVCAYDALARVLTQASVDDRRRAASGDLSNALSSERTPTVLLMVEPGELDLAAMTHEAAQRFASHAACWQYDASETPALRAVSESDVEGWGHEPRRVVETNDAAPKRIATFVPGTATRNAASRSSVTS